MIIYQRRSPVVFPSRPLKTDIRDNWTVVLEYADEGDGPYVIDLSHKVKWDVQSADISNIKPFGLTIPEKPGECLFKNSVLAGRLNRTQAMVWDLSETPSETPDQNSFTDVTEAQLLMAIVGREASQIFEKLTALDFNDPGKKSPYVLQGPVSHVPSRVVSLRSSEPPVFLLSCSRGYGHSMVEAVLDAGREWDMTAAGENMFLSFF